MINFFIEYLYTLIYVVALSYVISLTYPYIRKENMLRNIMVILSYTFVLNIVTYTSPHNGWLYVIGNLMCISLDFIYCGVLVKRFRLNKFVYHYNLLFNSNYCRLSYDCSGARNF